MRHNQRVGNNDPTVILNVYDLTPYNSYAYWCGVGVFHTGLEVYGVEYAFGGHDYDASGVFATRPREPPGNVEFREAIVIGPTQLSAAAVQSLVAQLGAEYKGNAYHLLQRNCNHFAASLCLALTGQPAPAWINRLASVAVSLHCLLPASWVPPLATPSAAPAEALERKGRAGGREERHVLITAPTSDRPFVAGGAAGPAEGAAARDVLLQGLSDSEEDDCERPGGQRPPARGSAGGGRV